MKRHMLCATRFNIVALTIRNMAARKILLPQLCRATHKLVRIQFLPSQSQSRA